MPALHLMFEPDRFASLRPNPLVRAFRMNSKRALESSYAFVPTIEEADWCILPHLWNDYIRHGLEKVASTAAAEAEKKGKLLLVWCSGDQENVVPFRNAIQIDCGLHRTLPRKVALALEAPVEVEDFVRLYRGGAWSPIPKAEVPLLGFCGQGRYRLSTQIHRRITNAAGKILFHAGRAKAVPDLCDFMSLRPRILRHFESSRYVHTDFIIRDQYRAGLRTDDKRIKKQHATRHEFAANILRNMYTVCIRGGGNYSRRIYETLSCGRIPIVIDTDTVLPLEQLIDWKRYVVWVNHSDIDRAAEVVCDFHSDRSSDDFIELQHSCRTLWRNYLTGPKFLSHLGRLFGQTGTATHTESGSTVEV